jgi:AcrR family transcriptional regulator
MGLRERKRERTRQALADAALELFAQRGYDATTIADIAARADVSPRTFFSHHPSKEHVLFSQDDETLASLAGHLAARPAGQPTLDALRDWIGTIVDEYDFTAGNTRERLRRQVIEQTPVLLAHERELRGRFEVVIRSAVASELGDRPEDLRPRLVAAAATAALESTRPEHGAITGPDEALARVDAALTFLRGGLNALRTS